MSEISSCLLCSASVPILFMYRSSCRYLTIVSKVTEKGITCTLYPGRHIYRRSVSCWNRLFICYVSFKTILHVHVCYGKLLVYGCKLLVPRICTVQFLVYIHIELHFLKSTQMYKCAFNCL